MRVELALRIGITMLGLLRFCHSKQKGRVSARPFLIHLAIP
jgi:hypothetical protein